MELPGLDITWTDWSLWEAAFAIMLCPLQWLLMTWLERRFRVLQKLFGQGRISCLVFGFLSLCLCAFRACRFLHAVDVQPKCYGMRPNWVLLTGHGLHLFGFFMIVLSFLQLGLYSTFYGEAFGMFSPGKRKRFPYNIIQHPMYFGTSCMGFGWSFVMASQAGVWLSVLAVVCYKLFTMYEQPFIEDVYEHLAEEKDK